MTSLQQTVDLLNTKYRGWRLVSIEKVPSSSPQIVDRYHSGVFLFVKLEKEQEETGEIIRSGFTITEKAVSNDDPMYLFDYEESLRYLFQTDYDFDMENETEARIYEEQEKKLERYREEKEGVM